MFKKHLCTFCCILFALAAFSWAIPYPGKTSRYDFGATKEQKQLVKDKIKESVQKLKEF